MFPLVKSIEIGSLPPFGHLCPEHLLRISDSHHSVVPPRQPPALTVSLASLSADHNSPISQFHHRQLESRIGDSAHCMLFPNLRRVRITPKGVQDIRETVVYPHNQPPPFLLALAAQSRPETLAITFNESAKTPAPTQMVGDHICRSVSSHWTRDINETGLVQRDGVQGGGEGGKGGYTFLKRLMCLYNSGWDSISHLEVDGINREIIPSFPSCHNIYTFSVPSEFESTLNPIEAEDGAIRRKSSWENGNGQGGGELYDSSLTFGGMEGVNWEYRTWQLYGAVRNVLTLSPDMGDIAGQTIWTFVDYHSGLADMGYDDKCHRSGRGSENRMVREMIEEAVMESLDDELRRRCGGCSIATQVKERIFWGEERDTRGS